MMKKKLNLYGCGFRYFEDEQEPICRSSFMKLRDEVNDVIGMSWTSVQVTIDSGSTVLDLNTHKAINWSKIPGPTSAVRIYGNDVYCLVQGRVLRYDGDDWKECEDYHGNSVILMDLVDNELLVVHLDGSLWKRNIQVVIPEKVDSISCGKEHAIILTETRQVYTMGGGSRGQLGCGIVKRIDKLTHIEILDGLDIVKVSAGGWHSCCLSFHGDVYVWGWNQSGQLGFPTRDNDPDGINIQAVPLLLDLWSVDRKVIDISCGSRHTLALLDKQELWSWGWNDYGQLGHSSKSGDPGRVHLPDFCNIKRVYCGPWASYYLAEADS